MSEDWDSTPAPSKPVCTGFGVGRGRGFVGAAKVKPSFGSAITTSSNNSTSNSMWDETPSNNNTSSVKQFEDVDEWDTSSTTNQSNGWNSGGGGRTGGGGGGGSRACFKCNEEGHQSRDCPKGGGGSRACFKCNEEGHQSRDCPKGGGGGGSRVCFKCNEEGHMSRECPNSGSGGGGGSRACFKCNEDGHMSRDCPNGGSGGGGGGGRRACFKCNEEGHMSRDCPNGGSGGGGGGSRACFKCNEEGHMSRDCPNGGGGGGGGRECRKCGEEGHMARDCPTGDGQRKTGCHRCGEEGHISKDCEKEPQTRTLTDEAGKVREIYVPPEYTNDEGELFTGTPTGINFDKYDSIKVDVSGNNSPKPVLSFQQANLSKTLLDNIAKAKYTKPTPVQKYTIPIVRASRDLMACAQTGSGKTAAFLIPIIQAMFEATNLPNNTYQETQEPWAVIVSPTRELAIQIHQEARKFSLGSIVKTALIYGGTSMQVQMSRLSKGCHILVATPGRLKDFVDKGKVSFAQVKFFILDEADRMLDMGFGPEVRRMVDHPTMPAKDQRVNLLFSATFSEEVQGVAAQMLKDDYLFLRVGVVGAANQDVEQVVLQVARFEKRDKLLQILAEAGTNDRTLVFVETKKQADFVASFISQKNYPCTSIHGDRLQREREEALNDFRAGRKPILTATAVAARGLDIRDVRHVINYDMPNTIDEYVHRIGRTGRVGNTGQSTSFFDVEKDGDLASPLIGILANANQEVPDWLEALGKSGGSFGGGSTFTSRDVRQGMSKSSWQNDNTIADGEESWEC